MPEDYAGLKEVFLVDGAFECEFDVLEDQLDPDMCNRLRHETGIARDHTNYLMNFEGALEESDFMPLGVNSGRFPAGAILRELK